MSKEEKKGFVKEFKEFISRGNIVDMAVGVVVGGAFTTIVNTMVKSVFTPLVNYIIYLICGGKEGDFSSLDITLIPATSTIESDGTVIETPATIIGFSDLITAIINFLLIALVLFVIVKVINKVRAQAEELKAKLEKDDLEEKTTK